MNTAVPNVKRMILKMINIIEAVDQIYEKKGVKKRIAGNKLTAEGWKNDYKRQERTQMGSLCDY